jgi:acetolactate synthase II small subunit
MTGRLDITLGRSEGALVRLLGLTERRGYPCVSVAAVTTTHNTFKVELTVESDRPLEQLARQVRKLYDVATVEIAR